MATTPVAVHADPGTGYTMVDLGTLGQSAQANAINAASEVVGSYYDPAVAAIRAFVYSPGRTGGQLVDLPGPCSLCSLNVLALSVNDQGDVAGIAYAGGQTAPVLWVNGVMSYIGPFGLHGRASSINNQQQVVGTGLVGASDSWHAFIWSAQTGTRDISPTLGYGAAYDVNDQGQVVGACGSAILTSQACLWEPDGTVRVLAGVPGLPAAAYAINNQGVVVGDYTDANQHTIAFRWADGTRTDLTGAADSPASATDINDCGTITGYWYTYLPGDGARTETGAWVWQAGESTNLSTSPDGQVGGPAKAAAINRSGVIAGSIGSTRSPTNTNSHAVRWQPQPAAAR